VNNNEIPTNDNEEALTTEEAMALINAAEVQGEQSAAMRQRLVVMVEQGKDEEAQSGTQSPKGDGLVVQSERLSASSPVQTQV